MIVCDFTKINLSMANVQILVHLNTRSKIQQVGHLVQSLTHASQTTYTSFPTSDGTLEPPESVTFDTFENEF